MANVLLPDMSPQKQPGQRSELQAAGGSVMDESGEVNL